MIEQTKKKGKKKKKSQMHVQKCITDRNEESPATGVNIEALKKIIRPDVLTITRKTIMQIITLNLQKTSIGLGNLRVGD